MNSNIMTTVTVPKSCSIFFYEGWVDASPLIVSLAKSLNECGYWVTIYATNYMPNNQPNKIGDKTTIVYLPSPSNIPLLMKMHKIKMGSIARIFELVIFLMQICIYVIRNKKINDLKNNRFTVAAAGVNRYSSIAALLQSYLFKQKLIYFSIELIDPDSLGKLKYITEIINSLERLTYRKAECVLTQDKDRFETLCAYNKYKHGKVFFLPNSPIHSDLDQSHQVSESKNYFREIFTLNEEDFPYLIVSAGIINHSVFSREIAKSFSFIKGKYALIFNSSAPMSLEDPYVKSLKEANSRNLFLSLNPLSHDQVDKMFESITIGLAIYMDSDSHKHITKASGKLTHYLKHGKPVIVSNIKNLSEFVNNYEIGAVIKDPSNSLEMEEAIEKILNNYDSYSKNARLCFEEEFDFSGKVKPFLSLVNSF